MKSKKSKSKSMPECPNCGLPAETKDQLCSSCAVIHQELVDLTLKRSIMIRYAPLYFYDAISLYRTWQNGSKWQRVLKRAHIIAEWLDRNKHNKAQIKKYQDLHALFVEFVGSILTSNAEEKVEEMLRILEES